MRITGVKMIAINVQPKEGLVIRTDGSLDVFDIWPTIQGEGPLVGTPAVFVRMAGCNLTCSLCDTDYTSKRQLMAPSQLLEKITHYENPSRLIVLTGGEPFRQGIGPFVTRAIENDFRIQIETNGTLFVPNLPYCHRNLTIVCSPKAPKISQQLEPFINAFKYILDANSVDPADGLPITSMRSSNLTIARPNKSSIAEIFVQPLDEDDLDKNKRNLEATISSCRKFGYRLSLQTHKIMGLP